MGLFMQILFSAIILFYCYRFLIVLVKMKQEVVLPTSAEKLTIIRKYPEKIVKAPTYSMQKAGIITYALMLVYVITLFIIGQYFADFYWQLYLLILLPVFHLSNLMNMFAVVQDGIICGARFVPWKKIKSFAFVRIDINHRFYGFSKEVNDQYEMKIKTRFETLSCVITSEEMKGKLSNMLKEHHLTELEVKENVMW